MTTTETAAKLVRVARVCREFGVHGEIAVMPLGGDVTRFQPGLSLQVEGSPERLTVKRARSGPHQEVLLSVAELNLPEQAAKLRDAYLCVDTTQRRQLGEDEWFVSDLIGMQVVDQNQAVIGTVADVEEHPAHPILVIATGGGQQLIPLVKAFVQEVDVEHATIHATPWEWEGGQ